jgi:hypothetical protein
MKWAFLVEENVTKDRGKQHWERTSGRKENQFVGECQGGWGTRR